MAISLRWLLGRSRLRQQLAARAAEYALLWKDNDCIRSSTCSCPDLNRAAVKRHQSPGDREAEAGTFNGLPGGKGAA